MGIKPEGKHREELVDELLQKERAIQKAREKAKSESKVHKERIGALEARREELVDLLEGREGVQPPLPLTTKSGKPEVLPLQWEKAGESQVARAGKAGTYCVEPMASGRFAVFFTAPGLSARSKRLGEVSTEAEGKALAQKDWLEKAADAALENAGDGKLTKGGRAKIAKMEARS